MNKIWVKVASPGDVEPDSVRPVSVGTSSVALVNAQGEYFALNNQCPHMGGPLSQGALEDGRLACPWHGHAFDLRSGKCESFAVGATCYPTEVRDDGIYVEIEDGGEA